MAAHLTSRATVEASGLSSTQWAPNFDPGPWFKGTSSWTEEHAGGWKFQLTAQKTASEQASGTTRFTAGPHIVELGHEPDDILESLEADDEAWVEVADGLLVLEPDGWGSSLGSAAYGRLVAKPRNGRNTGSPVNWSTRDA